jgi:ribosomal protein S18 acetylase RimI-like enzyme
VHAMDTITVKTARPDDEAALFELFCSVRTEELDMQGWDASLSTQILRLQFDAQRRGYRQRFTAEEQLIRSGDSAIGWVVVDRSGPVLRCLDIALVSKARGRGIGTDVLRALQAEAASSGWPLVVTVLRTNVRAVRFYTRLGFRTGSRTDAHLSMEWRG